MILSDTAIAELLAKGDIELRPTVDQGQLRPVGIRVHLARDLLVPVPGQLVDLARPTALKYEKVDIRERNYVLEPGGFILGSTVEQVRTRPQILCLLEGRSTIARLGLTIHNTASVLDGTYMGWLTPVLEIANHGNFRVSLAEGMPIGMLCFQHLAGESSRQAYHGQYRDQSATTPPNLTAGAKVLRGWDGAQIGKAQLTLFQTRNEGTEGVVAKYQQRVPRKRGAKVANRQAGDGLKGPERALGADEESGGLVNMELWQLSRE